MQKILQVKITYDETLAPREHHVFSHNTNIIIADAKTLTAEFSDTEASKMCFAAPKANVI